MSHSKANQVSDIGSDTSADILANVGADVGTDATPMQRWIT